jgi:hypothetical protein
MTASRTARFGQPRRGIDGLPDDGDRLTPTYTALGDDSVPCRWWHHDVSPYCARCGSARMDLHDGVWDSLSHPLGSVPFRATSDYGPSPWTDVERLRLGLPVAEQWWHQAAGVGT